MSRSLCIRSCGRRRSPPSILCLQCQQKELGRMADRTGRLKRRLNQSERIHYGIPPKNRQEKP
jgi:hypothetical protein